MPTSAIFLNTPNMIGGGGGGGPTPDVDTYTVQIRRRRRCVAIAWWVLALLSGGLHG